MISFAALFAFYLSTGKSSGAMNLAPSVGRLIEESADVLERIGSTPKHRNGTSALYGRHLREVIATASTPSPKYVYQQGKPQTPYPHLSAQQTQNYQTGMGMTPQNLSEQLLQFSAMSDDQITEAINNAGAELENCLPDFQVDDKTGLDWLDWFNLETSNYGN